MIISIIQNYLFLLRVELVLGNSGLGALHELVRSKRIHHCNRNRQRNIEDLCRAVDLACAFYPKRVLCLQRAAATTLFLRQHGYEAAMLIGAQMLPFKSHAWVEVNGHVVNDKPYMHEIYQVLERC